jgi:hypothetical protein
MTQFHEGQEVEVGKQTAIAPHRGIYATEWGKATIVRRIVRRPYDTSRPDGYEVEFHDGTRDIFDADHIRHPRNCDPAGSVDACCAPAKPATSINRTRRGRPS